MRSAKEKSCNEIGMGAEHHKLHFAHSTSGGGGANQKLIPYQEKGGIQFARQSQSVKS